MKDEGYMRLEDAEKSNAPIWRDKEGYYHPITEISDRYLENIVNSLYKWRGNISNAMNAGWSTLGMVSGEMAEYAIEGGITFLEEKVDEIQVWIEALEDEQTRREEGGDEYDYYYVINEEL